MHVRKMVKITTEMAMTLEKKESILPLCPIYSDEFLVCSASLSFFGSSSFPLGGWVLLGTITAWHLFSSRSMWFCQGTVNSMKLQMACLFVWAISTFMMYLTPAMICFLLLIICTIWLECLLLLALSSSVMANCSGLF